MGVLVIQRGTLLLRRDNKLELATSYLKAILRGGEMLISGVSVASINPPIYQEALLDLANHLCVINRAVCMIMPQLFNTRLIKTAGKESFFLNFSYSPPPPSSPAAQLALTISPRTSVPPVGLPSMRLLARALSPAPPACVFLAF